MTSTPEPLKSTSPELDSKIARQTLRLSVSREGLWIGFPYAASPIRTIFREAFASAGLPYFNPHSFRNTLVQLGQKVCQTPEQFKAWSQNLGHEKILTTFPSYGEVTCQRQGEIIRGLAAPQQALQPGANEIAEPVFKRFRESGVDIREE